MEEMEQILKEILKTNTDFLYAAITSIEALPIISVLPQNIRETEFSAIVGTFISLSEVVDNKMNIGDAEYFIIKGKKEYLISMKIKDSAILSVLTKAEMRLGLILLECERTCKKLEKFL